MVKTFNDHFPSPVPVEQSIPAPARVWRCACGDAVHGWVSRRAPRFLPSLLRKLSAALTARVQDINSQIILPGSVCASKGSAGVRYLGC